ncbi:MAG: hypothetical protein ACRDQ0_23760 [Pseudonocardia sp.]
MTRFMPLTVALGGKESVGDKDFFTALRPWTTQRRGLYAGITVGGSRGRGDPVDLQLYGGV